MFCPNCGKEIKPGQRFCVGCGTKASLKNADPVQDSESIEIKNLVERAKSGDESAFQALYEKTNKRNYYVALKMVKTDADAQDVLQDAYIRIYQHLDQYTYNGESSFASWSSKIVSNTALNHLRKKQAVLFSDIEGDQEGDFTLEIEDEDESRQPELAYDKKETSQIVQELLDTLSDEQRVCAMMFYYQEQSVKEIASEIGCSENTVKSRLNYARKNMMGKAEELKKRGILTGILSMAGLFAILRSNEALASVSTPDTSAFFAKLLSEGNSESMGVSGMGTSGIESTSSLNGTASISGASASTTASTVAGAAGTGIGAKIAIGALCGTLAVAGGAAVFMNLPSGNNNTTVKELSTENVDETDNSPVSGGATSTTPEPTIEPTPERKDPLEYSVEDCENKIKELKASKPVKKIKKGRMEILSGSIQAVVNSMGSGEKRLIRDDESIKEILQSQSLEFLGERLIDPDKDWYIELSDAKELWSSFFGFKEDDKIVIFDEGGWEKTEDDMIHDVADGELGLYPIEKSIKVYEDDECRLITGKAIPEYEGEDELLFEILLKRIDGFDPGTLLYIKTS